MFSDALDLCVQDLLKHSKKVGLESVELEVRCLNVH